jgi:hypothetical protein
MALVLGRKWLRLILAAYLAVAVLGIFTFIATEPLRSIDFWGDKPVSGGFFTPIDLSIDCLAEGTTIMSKARGHSFSPLRAGALRMAAPPGAQYTGTVPVQSSFRAIETVNHRTIKNAILLKLRI